MCSPSPVYCQGCLRVQVEDVRDLCEECEKAREEAAKLCPYCPNRKDKDAHSCGSIECLSWLASDLIAAEGEDEPYVYAA